LALTPGTRLGIYEITALLGDGEDLSQRTARGPLTTALATCSSA
jgi:hypothetical protein